MLLQQRQEKEHLQYKQWPAQAAKETFLVSYWETGFLKSKSNFCKKLYHTSLIKT